MKNTVEPKLWRSTLSILLVAISATGCVLDEPEAETGDEAAPELGSTTQAITADTEIFGGAWTDVSEYYFTIEEPQTVFVTAKITGWTERDAGVIFIARLLCSAGGDSDYVYSTINVYDDGNPPTQVPQYLSLLYHAPSGPYIACKLQATTDAGYSMWIAGDRTKTYMNLDEYATGWAWGTDFDANNAIDNNGHDVTIIGSGLQPATVSSSTGESCSSDASCDDGVDPEDPCDNPIVPCKCVSNTCRQLSYSAEETDVGTSEYVLKGRRLEARGAPIDVYSDLELTCQTDNSDRKCNVTAKVHVQRMKSSTSSIVCKTTTTSQTFDITGKEHHKKVRVAAMNVPTTAVTCTDGTPSSGRSFIIKSQVTLNSTSPSGDVDDYVVVEYGDEDPAFEYNRGYSITNVVE